ncbi:RNA polymerase sigma factor [candidate division KSB1 bacterium]|nr:RNA polymerase sigma factor [candidate division KSB1 bacterium]
MENSEINLVHQAQAGDIKSFDMLIEMYGNHVMQTAYSMVGNLQDAQDIYQETFMRAFDKISTFRLQSSFKTWLTRIVINLSINLRRKKKIVQFVSIFDTDEENKEVVHNFMADFSHSPEKNLTSQELKQQIARSLNLLSAKERAVFILKQYQDYRIREIAVILNCAEGTVKNYLFRATKKIQKYLMPYYQMS